MVSDSKKKRLEAKAAKAAAEGKPIGRVKSAASLKKTASVADSLASQIEEGTCLLLCDVCFPLCASSRLCWCWWLTDTRRHTLAWGMWGALEGRASVDCRSR